jgi:succinoglycan biosynthesis transport protein ExoP
VQQQSFPISEARVISYAETPPKKSYPRTSIVLAVSTFGGLLLGFAAAMFIDLSDRAFRTCGQLESSLHTNCIAMVPLLAGNSERRGVVAWMASLFTLRAKPKDLQIWSKGARRAAASSSSPFADAIRSIKLAINGVDKGLHKPGSVAARRSSKIIGVTSTLFGEGKTTIAANVAAAIADTNERVLLIDCDFRNPSLSRSVSRDTMVGLLDIVAGDCSFEEAIKVVQSTNLAFLPIGRLSPSMHASDILASEAMKMLFDSLRDDYDVIIVDLSPLVPFIDARSTACLIDSYIVVAEWGRTRTDVAHNALEAARNVRENLLGVVLNKVDLKILPRYEGAGAPIYGKL